MRTLTQMSAVRLRPRVQTWIGPLLVLAAIVTRLPVSGWLYHWDSVNFAFALERFDIAQGQPHAPGYLLYVLLGRVAATLTGNAQRGLVLLAIGGSALAVLALYDLGRRLWDAPTGVLAALLLLSSPLFWFYGQVALPHTLDALAVIVAATLSWHIMQGQDRVILGLAIWLGLAGGLRQQTLVFMLPLALVACWHVSRRWQLGALAILVVTVLAWLIPLLALSGGLARYLAIVGSYSATFDRPTSVLLGAGWHGLAHNLDKLARYTLWGWAGGIVLLVGLRRPFAWRRTGWMRSRPSLFALWIGPCLLFYTLIHMGQQGLIFVYLPVLLLVSARGGIELWRSRRPALQMLPVLALMLNIGLYLGAPSELLPGRFKVLSRATLRQHDALLAAQLDAVRLDLPSGALLLSDEWRFPQYYLPNVTLIPYRHSSDDSAAITLDLTAAQQDQIATASALAWYEPSLDAFDRAPEQTTRATERQGVQLRILRPAAGAHLVVTASSFGFER